MRLSGKFKLLKKTPVGAASSRELKRLRLEAAPTKSKTPCSFQITGNNNLKRKENSV
jgi:hypothetical protein